MNHSAVPVDALADLLLSQDIEAAAIHIALQVTGGKTAHKQTEEAVMSMAIVQMSVCADF